MRKRVAVVGSGCSGLGALWALKTGSEHEVHLFEANSHIGGQAQTVTFEGQNGRKVEIDTSLIILNGGTAPNFTRFLGELGVPTQELDFTWSVARDHGTFEWANKSLSSVFAQPSNILAPRMWLLSFEIIRFKEFAPDLLREETVEEENGPVSTACAKVGKVVAGVSIGRYLEREHYSRTFRDDYFFPVLATICGNTPDKSWLEIPAVNVIRMLYNHEFLRMSGMNRLWQTVAGGSRQYVQAVMKDFPRSQVHLECKVSGLTPTKKGSVILTANDKDYELDQVILAIPPQQALDILRHVAGKQETAVLSACRTSRTVAVLHADPDLMPKRKAAWSAINVLSQSPFPSSRVGSIPRMCLTYHLNVLYGIPEDKFGPALVTVNPFKMPDPALAHGIWEYLQPVNVAEARQAQRRLSKIQNIRGISYCGAWTGDGSYEAGLASGLSAAVGLGAKMPFALVDSRLSLEKPPSTTIRKHTLRLAVLLVQLLVLLMERAFLTTVAISERHIAKLKKAA